MNTRDDTSATNRQRDFEVDRRKFLAVGGALATTLVAGCSGDNAGDATGTFRLFVSDQPVAIEEFDSLDVTIDGARLFQSEEDADATETTATETTTDATTESDETDTTNETATTTDGTEPTTTETGGEAEEEEESEQEGVIEIDVDDVTVDLTTVLGENAIGVFDGEVPTGRYATIHLSVAQAEGVVDGEDVDVMVPSERLKIVKPFEVTEDEPVEFVFDITVVKKGATGEYNLTPVVGESGVVGEHVEMREVERNRGNATATTDATGD